MTDGDHFTISRADNKKVKEAFDKWKHRKLSKSQKICEAIIKLHEQEEKGNKITIYTGEQSKLPTLPPVYEPLKPEDLVGLSYDEKRTIYYALGQSLTVVEKDIRKAEAQR